MEPTTITLIISSLVYIAMIISSFAINNYKTNQNTKKIENMETEIKCQKNEIVVLETRMGSNDRRFVEMADKINKIYDILLKNIEIKSKD